MDSGDRDFLSDVMRRAGALGLAWWERLVLILAVAVLLVGGKRIWAALPRPPPHVPDLSPDVGGERVPDAEWDTNVAPNTDEPGSPGGG